MSYTNIIARFSWVGWYRVMFASIAASERLLVISPSSVIGAGPYVTTDGSNYIRAHGGQNVPFQYSGTTGASEVSIPWSYPERFINGAFKTNDSLANSAGRVNFVYASASKGGTQPLPTVFHALGDDIRVGRFLQTPGIQMRSGSAPSYPGNGFFQ